jgi:hypothetical protein
MKFFCKLGGKGNKSFVDNEVDLESTQWEYDQLLSSFQSSKAVWSPLKMPKLRNMSMKTKYHYL